MKRFRLFSLCARDARVRSAAFASTEAVTLEPGEPVDFVCDEVGDLCVARLTSTPDAEDDGMDVVP